LFQLYTEALVLASLELKHKAAVEPKYLEQAMESFMTLLGSRLPKLTEKYQKAKSILQQHQGTGEV
jgi:hypothetical protein